MDKAINLYENIKSSNNDLEFKRLHNLGNSYAKNDFQNAITNYENALKLKNDKETKENLELLKKALEDKKNKENKEQDKKQEPEMTIQKRIKIMKKNKIKRIIRAKIHKKQEEKKSK